MKGAEYLTERMVSAGVIAKADEEIYQFGLEQGFWMVLNLVTALAWSAVWGMLAVGLCFMAAYMPLRIYAGGYHARTPLRCYGGGIVLLTAALVLMRQIPWTLAGSAVVMALAGGLLCVLAPVADENKPLSGREKLVYARRARRIAAAETAAALLAGMAGWQVVVGSVSTMVVIMAALLLLGKLRQLLLSQEAGMG